MWIDVTEKTKIEIALPFYGKELFENIGIYYVKVDENEIATRVYISNVGSQPTFMEYPKANLPDCVAITREEYEQQIDFFIEYLKTL